MFVNVGLESAAHVVQLALTPVFLLTGIAGLLNVFANRLARVADQTEALERETGDAPSRDGRLRLLEFRSHILDFSVVMAALAGAATCIAAGILFLGEVLGAGTADLFYSVFGAALAFTMMSILGFVTEMLLTAHGLRGTLSRLAQTWREQRRP